MLKMSFLEASWGHLAAKAKKCSMCFGSVVLKLPYGTLAEVPKSTQIVLGFAVLSLPLADRGGYL